MYVEPNTQIHILQGVPLSKSYEHTVRYKNATEQYNGFIAYLKHTLNNYSYQRAGLGTIRVQLPYAQVYNCNYMMFKNTSYEDRWFYAFITGASYLSNDVTEVYYMIDVMQTFAYDYQFKNCYIERTHTATDVPYENTQPEGLELGPDYRILKSHEINLVSNSQSDKKFVILATTNPSGANPSPSVVGNTVYVLSRIECTGVSDVMNTVKSYIDNGIAANIIGVYTVPNVVNPSVSFTRSKALDGYVPRNNKLYTYPYTFMEMNNRVGDVLELKYENFFRTDANSSIKSLEYVFKLQAFTNYSIIPEARLFPLNYLVGSTD